MAGHARHGVFRMDWLDPDRRVAWQRAADRNGVTLSEFVRAVVDRAARFGDGWDGPLPWEPSSAPVGSSSAAPVPEPALERPNVWQAREFRVVRLGRPGLAKVGELVPAFEAGFAGEVASPVSEIGRAHV